MSNEKRGTERLQIRLDLLRNYTLNIIVIGYEPYEGFSPPKTLFPLSLYSEQTAHFEGWHSQSPPQCRVYIYLALELGL